MFTDISVFFIMLRAVSIQSHYFQLEMKTCFQKTLQTAFSEKNSWLAKLNSYFVFLPRWMLLTVSPNISSFPSFKTRNQLFKFLFFIAVVVRRKVIYSTLIEIILVSAFAARYSVFPKSFFHSLSQSPKVEKYQES